MSRKLLLFAVMLSFSLVSFGQETYDFPVRSLVLPEFPQVGDTVSVEGSIVLPHPGFSIDHITHEFDEPSREITVYLHIYVDVLGFYPQVEHVEEFRYVFESPAEYRTSIQEFVTITQVPVESSSELEPLQDSIYESLTLQLFPKPLLAGKPINLTVNGTYPTTGYQLLSRSVSVFENTVLVEFNILPSLNRALIPTPFSESVQIRGLQEGRYELEVLLNSVSAFNESIPVEPRQSQPLEFNPFGARLSIAPEANPEKPHQVRVTGEFPTGGWTLQLVDTITADNFTSFEIEAIPPDGPAITVITPFDELIATLDLGVGFHYFRGTINGHVIPPTRIYVGEVPPQEHLVNEWITLRRSGGIAGENSWITIDREGNFTRQVSFVGNHDENTGTIPPQKLDELIQELEATGLENYPVVIPANANVADVFEYHLVYNEAAVKIEYLDTAPEELQKIVREIESVLNNPSQTSSVAPKEWQRYN